MGPTDSDYLIEHVASVLHRQSDQVLQERLGIGISQYKILSLLERRPDIKQRAVADALGQTEASISRQVKLLSQKGLLSTQVDPEEHRRHLAVLTARGVKITRAAQEIVSQFHEPLFAQLNGREQAQLRRLLIKLHEYSCSPGKRMSCDALGDIGTVYAIQKTMATKS